MQKLSQGHLTSGLFFLIPLVSLYIYIQRVWFQVYNPDFIFTTFKNNSIFFLVPFAFFLKKILFNKIKITNTFLKFSGIIFLYCGFLLSSADPKRFLLNPIFQIINLYFLGTWVRGLLQNLSIPVPIWVSWLVGLFLLYLSVLLTAYFGVYSIYIPYAAISFSALFSLLFFRQIIKEDFYSLNSLTNSEIFWLELVFAACLVIVIASQAPDYAFDSARYYIPLMRRIAEQGALVANPYSFMENLSWAIQTLGAIGHSFEPETGGKFFSGPLFFILTNMILIHILNKDFSIPLKSSFVGALCFSLTPHIFIYAGTGYYDLAGAVTSFGCFYLFKLGVEKNPRYLFLFILVVAFAYLTKLFSIFVCFVSVVTLVLFSPNKKEFLQSVYKIRLHLMIASGIILILVSPRLYLTFKGTGDPFFPIFASKLDSSRWAGLSQVLLPGKDFFHYPHHFIVDIILFPFFATIWADNRIDEGPAGYLGSFLIAFYYLPFLIIYSRIRLKNNEGLKSSVLYFCMFLLLICLISVLHAPNLRYWYPAYIFLFVFIFVTLESYSRSSKNFSRYLAVLTGICIVINFPLLIQYPGPWTPSWFPGQIHTGKSTPLQFEETQGWHKATHFLNQHNTENAPVLSSLFYTHSQIKAQVIDMTPWWDSYNKLDNSAQVKDAIKNINAGYWIIGKEPLAHREFYVHKGFEKDIWSKSKLVYEDQGYTIYQLEDPSI